MPKRAIVDSGDEASLFAEESPKRAKSNGERRLEDEYVCPITHELFIDPVTAEDGRVYERAAIKHMFEVCAESTSVARSPITNEPMGTKLFPAHQVKSALSLLIAEKVITGDRAEAWNEHMKKAEENRRTVNNLKRSAEEGDAQAMHDLGLAFRKGMYGLDKDDVAGYLWYKRASDLGHATAMCKAGQSLLTGRGVREVKTSLGLAMVFAAAWRGSEHACSEIARWFCYGGTPLSVDLVEARFYYKKMQQACIKDSNADCRGRAKAFLDSTISLDSTSTRRAFLV